MQELNPALHYTTINLLGGISTWRNPRALEALAARQFNCLVLGSPSWTIGLGGGDGFGFGLGIRDLPPIMAVTEDLALAVILPWNPGK